MTNVPKTKLMTMLIVTLFTTSAFMAFATANEGGSPESRDFATHAPIIISSDAGFTLENGVKSGTGSESNPYDISGWEITASSGNAISIGGTTKFFSISHCRIFDVGGTNYGITISGASNVDVSYNVFEGNANALMVKNVNLGDIAYNTFIDNTNGVIIDESQTVNVDYNSITGSKVGVTITSTDISKSKDHNVDYNTIIGGDIGVYLKKTDASNIDYNTITDAKAAIKLEDVRGTNADYNTLVGGTNGMDLKGTDGFDATYNLFKNFTSYAVTSATSSDNSYTFNNFENNGGTGKQAKATGVTNDDWDGNFWDDWTTPDSEPDGIVDLPYQLDGGEAQDNEPLAIKVPGAGTGISTLTVSAYADKATGPKPHKVTFYGSVTGGVSPYTYAWVFGDGNMGTGQTVSHTYETTGSYSAVLTVVDSMGASKSSSAIAITVENPPDPLTAAISADKNEGEYPFTVSFTSAVTGGVTPYTYAWDFGDDNTSTQANPSHTYEVKGTYSVKLKVTDSKGTLKDATTISITVKTPVPPLDVSIAASKTTIKAGSKVTFTANVTGGVAPYTYSWNFLDGGTSTEANPTHTFKRVGPYIVTLTVSDSTGDVEIALITITVQKKEDKKGFIPGFEMAILALAVTMVLAIKGVRRRP
jgi:PKD repeat protein